MLRDVDGHRFMPDYEPEKAELASRDVVSRRMAEHMRRGKGVKGDGPEHLWLDITGLGAAHIDRKLREVRDICHHFLGIDPAREWIPVRPTQHYSMGGIRTDHRGESPTLRGLFACGEAACWDLHGFNRLGGNSVAETVVAGMLVGEYVADHVRDEGSAIRLSPRWREPSLPASRPPSRRSRPPGRRGRACHPPRNGRNHDRAGRAVPRRGRPRHRGRNAHRPAGASQAHRHPQQAPRCQPELVLAWRLPKMLKLALVAAEARWRGARAAAPTAARTIRRATTATGSSAPW